MSNIKKFKKLLKAANNEYATIAKDGLICGDIPGYIDTGIVMLNALISGKLDGGIPRGKVVAFAGEKGSGKTLLILYIIEKYLRENPNAYIVFFESEGALTRELLIERGIDVERLLVFPVAVVEDLRTQAVNILDTLIDDWKADGEYPECIFCLDSLGMLGTQHEIDTAKSGDNKADMGKRAQIIKSVFRIITMKLSLLKIPMLINNHTYQGMGKYDPKKMSGGQGLEFAASIIIFLTKAKIKEMKDKIRSLSGNTINMFLHKGRLTIEGSKISVDLDFKKGINRYSGILPMLTGAGILEKKGAWISYEGKPVYQGDKKFYEDVDNFIDDIILSKLEPYIMELFCYGTTEKAYKESHPDQKELEENLKETADESNS
jgi:RecA/RadA recombinase